MALISFNILLHRQDEEKLAQLPGFFQALLGISCLALGVSGYFLAVSWYFLAVSGCF